jgi:hypothetical protein
LQSICSFYLVEMVALGPPSLAAHFASKQEWILSFVFSPKLDTKVSMARLLGIVGTMNLSSTSSTFSLIFESLQQKITSTVLEECIGSTLGLGYLIGRLKYRYKSLSGFISNDMEVSIISTICEGILSSDRSEYLHAACFSISEIARYAPFSDLLLLPDGPLHKMIAKLKLLVKSSKEVKVRLTSLSLVSYQSIYLYRFKKLLSQPLAI